MNIAQITFSIVTLVPMFVACVVCSLENRGYK